MGGKVGPRVGSGQTFVGIRGSGRVNVSPGRVGSGPRKVTRGQLWCEKMTLVNENINGLYRAQKKTEA